MDEQLSLAEVIMRAKNDLREFNIDVTEYTEEDLFKIVNLLMVYQSTVERIKRK